MVHIDNFGNIKINTSCQDFKVGHRLRITVNGLTRKIPFAKTFSDLPPGKLLAYEGSHQILEIAKNLGSAAEEIKTNIGDIFSIKSLA